MIRSKKSTNDKEEIQDFEGLPEYSDENDAVINAGLKMIADFKRPDHHAAQELKDAEFFVGGEFKVVCVDIKLRIEECRVAGAAFLRERAKSGPAGFFLKPVAGVMSFVQKPDLCTAVDTFRLAILALEKHIPVANMNTSGCTVMSQLLHVHKDAKTLFEDKTYILRSASIRSLQELVDTMNTYIIDYKPYTVTAVDVARIKTEFVMSDTRSKLTAALESVEDAVDFVSKFMMALGREWDEVYKSVQASTLIATEQIAACSVCTAVYVTSESKQSVYTKLQSLRKTKSFATSPELGIKLPLALLTALEHAIHALNAEEKAAAPPKPKKKR